MEVHERIREIRENQKHWSQVEMAEKLHVHPNTYSNIENGITNLPLSRLKQIAKVFEVEPAELLEGVSEKNVFNVVGACNTNTHFNQSHITGGGSMEVVELKHELEKSRLLVERLEKENEYLKGIIEIVRQERRGGG